jgi:hypothetical protein
MLTCLILLPFLCTLVSSATYSLPSGDVWFRNPKKNTFKDAIEVCEGMDGNVIMVDTEFTKSQILEFMFLTDKLGFETWLDAEKNEEGKYVWRNKNNKEVNLTLLPFDEDKCHDNCCNLVLQPNGTIFSLSCEVNVKESGEGPGEKHRKEEKRGFVCELNPMTRLLGSLGKVQMELRQERNERKSLDARVVDLKRDYEPFKETTRRDFEEIKHDLDNEVTLRINLEEQLSALSKASDSYSKRMSSLQTSRTILSILCGVSVVAIIALSAMTCVVMERQKNGNFH